MDLVWFRGKDLRLSDHCALRQATSNMALLFVIDPYFFAPDRAKRIPHRIQFLLDALSSLSNDIKQRGGHLWIVKGPSREVVPDIAHRIGASRVLSQRWSDPLGRRRDEIIQAALNVPFVLTEGETLYPPGQLRTLGGKPYGVYTPFSKTFRRLAQIDSPLTAPKSFTKHDFPEDTRWTLASIPRVEDLGIERNPNLQKAGEGLAEKRLWSFINGPARDYDAGRDRMDLNGTSRISADLKFGVLSPRTVWNAIIDSDLPPLQKQKYTNELIWREFNYSTLYDNPKVLKECYKPAWNSFPWKNGPDHWEAWKTGHTGYPIVDAAARELLATGHIHNRARMITASFLTKHLLIDYKWGEAHFLKWLTDGDWAQNNMGWQWAAGCGADAQPWFRIFNPMTQGRKFDPTGAYVRKWLPELSSMDNRYIHAPWESPALSLSFSNVDLGKDYPHPIVEHKAARERFLDVAREHFKR